MFRNGALESELVSGSNSFLRRPRLNPAPSTEKRFLDELAQATALAGAKLKSNPDDTGSLYAMGIAYVRFAMKNSSLYRVMFGDFLNLSKCDPELKADASAAFQVMLGGLLVFLAGILIGSS